MSAPIKTVADMVAEISLEDQIAHVAYCAEQMKDVGRAERAMELAVLESLRKLKRAEHELELAFQVLEGAGVPRERARNVRNGIMVLDTRIQREERVTVSDSARVDWLEAQCRFWPTEINGKFKITFAGEAFKHLRGNDLRSAIDSAMDRERQLAQQGVKT